MSVRIRLSRIGRPHKPFYRMVAIDRTRARDAKPIEVLGTFNGTQGKKPDAVKVDRIRHWISVGATTSDTVRTTLKKLGIWNQVKPGSSAGA